MKIRLIFEGFGTPQDAAKKMQALEDLGIDARFLGSSKKIHHKFAIFNAGLPESTVVTGSANWSSGSQKNYDENIMFIYNETFLSNQFQQEFEKLWANSKDFGVIKNYTAAALIEPTSSQPSVVGYFNSNNFIFEKGTVRQSQKNPGFELTRTLIREIDEAQSTIDIATTRIKLRPLYDAILRASARGIKIRALVSMDEYTRFHAKIPLKLCQDIYSRECSTGDSYSLFLDRSDYAGHENVELRVKFYNLVGRNFITSQMHNKYIIIDNQKVLSGSFNWSISSEYEHLENIVQLAGQENGQAIQQFIANFEKLWDLNRDKFAETLNDIKSSDSPKCALPPMSLSLKQIDLLIYSARGKTCI